MSAYGRPVAGFTNTNSACSSRGCSERVEEPLRQVDHARFVGLRVLGLEPGGAGLEVEPQPLEVQDLALPHPRVEGDEQNWPEPGLRSRTTTKDVFYVAISRAQHEARIYTDDRARLPIAVERKHRKEAALDLDRR